MTEPPLKTVLVTDDGPQITHVIRVGLQRAGCRVIVAADGESAIGCASAEQVDLLILDIELPDMTGFELLRQIRSKPGCAEMPVIFITGSGNPKNHAEAEELGAAGFFTKPFSPTELHHRVKKVLSL